MRKTFYLVMLLMGCNSPDKLAAVNLIGKTIEYQYGESVYHVTFQSDSTLSWKAIAGDEVGVEGYETYVAEWIDSQRLFITWGEANGIGVSQVLDFNDKKVHNHLLQHREVSKGDGVIQIINN